MFWPSFEQAVSRAGIAIGLLSLPAGAAFAQAAAAVSGTTVRLQAVTAYHAGAADNPQALAMLAALSSAAGIPFFPKPGPGETALGLHQGQTPDPALCIRAGASLAPAVMSGPQMTVEHGLVGCPTKTDGFPVVIVQDPALAAPPTARSGEYDVDLTMRYRLIEQQHVRLIASVTEQGLGYSLDSPISGNNLVAALTLTF